MVENVAFEKQDGFYSNVDESVEYDVCDVEFPIMVESDGWMSLDCARQIRDDLIEAVRAVETNWAELASKKSDGG